MRGVTVLDSPAKNEYPMPINAYKKDEVFVGRIRKDFTQANTLNMLIQLLFSQQTFYEEEQEPLLVVW